MYYSDVERTQTMLQYIDDNCEYSHKKLHLLISQMAHQKDKVKEKKRFV